MPEPGAVDAEQLMPFDDVDVEDGVEPFGTAPVGRSLTESERADIARQLGGTTRDPRDAS